MRKAQYIVAALLEASPKGTTLRFGPGDDPYGEEFFSFEAALEGETEAERLQNGYSFATQKNPGDIGVYSLKPKINTMERGTELIAQTFGIKPEDNVNFAKGLEAPSKPVPLKDVFFERPMHKKSGNPEPERENPVKVAGVAAQPAEEPLEMTQPDAKREAYIQSLQGKPVSKNIPLDFGMEVDSTWRQGGVLVSHIIPGGPAAMAGLEAGDRIVRVGPFETSEGTWGPYKVRTLDEFKWVRSIMEPDKTAGLLVVRGGQRLPPMGIRPQHGGPQQKQSQDIHVGKSEARAYSRAWTGMEQDKHSLPTLTVDELAQAYKLEPDVIRGILGRIGARARDFVPSSEQPNDADPASKTGNQPANPSALTS